MPGVALIQVLVSLFVPSHYRLLFQCLYLYREEAVLSYVSALTAITMLNICAGRFSVDISSENELGCHHKVRWIMVSNLENIPLCLIPDTSLF